ncbi:Ionotropic receptor 670 [Blattella germanica]|nr:Ionotropic receptor 670 [Blattella germanica]
MFCFIDMENATIFTSIYIQTMSSLLSPEYQYLGLYIENVLQRHLAPGLPLLISLPQFDIGMTSQESSYLQEIESLLYILNEKSTWSLTIICCMRSNFVNYYSLEPTKQGYLIFLHPDRYANENNNNFINEISLLSAKKLLHFKGQVFVILNSESPHIFIPDVLKFLWKFNIIKVFVIGVRVNKSKDEKSFLGYSFSLYTRKPYHSNNKCLEFSNVIVLEKWKSGQKLTNLTQTFQHTIPNNFNGCPMKISSCSGNYKLLKQNEKMILRNYESLTQLLYIALEKLNITTIQNLPSKEINHIDIQRRVLLDVVLNKADIGSGVLLVKPASEIADYMRYYLINYVHWYAPCKQYKSQVTTLTGIFDMSVWFLIFSSIMSSAVIMTFICSFYTRNGVIESTTFQSISRSLCSLWAVLLGVGLFRLPRTFCLRSILLVFVCYSFSLNTIFQTYFTSLLMNPGYEHHISTINELLSSGLEFGYNPGYDYHFQGSPHSRDIQILKRRVACYNRSYCFDRVSKSGDFCYLDLEFIADMYKCRRKDVRMCTLHDGSMYAYSTIYMKKGSHLITIIETVFIQLYEAGIGFKLKEKQYAAFKSGKLNSSWFTNEAIENIGITLDNKDALLMLKHLQVAFYLKVIGILLSCVSFIMEIILHKFKIFCT